MYIITKTIDRGHHENRVVFSFKGTLLSKEGQKEDSSGEEGQKRGLLFCFPIRITHCQYPYQKHFHSRGGGRWLKLGGPTSQSLMGVGWRELQMGVMGPQAPGKFRNLTFKLVHLEWFETYFMVHGKFWNFTFKLMYSEGV